jgi:hypothetical protein
MNRIGKALVILGAAILFISWLRRNRRPYDVL